MMDSHVWSRRKGGERKKNFRNQLKVVRDELNFMATCTTCTTTTTPNLTLFFYIIDSREIGDGEIGSFFASSSRVIKASHSKVNGKQCQLVFM